MKTWPRIVQLPQHPLTINQKHEPEAYNTVQSTELEYISFRLQIKKGIETAKQPTVALNF